MDKLRKYLKENNLTILAFSRLIGVSVSTIARWLAGSSIPHSYMKKHVAIITHNYIEEEDWKIN